MYNKKTNKKLRSKNCHYAWVILDDTDGLKLASGFCYSTEEVARTYCRAKGETPFLLTMLSKPKYSQDSVFNKTCKKPKIHRNSAGVSHD